MRTDARIGSRIERSADGARIQPSTDGLRIDPPFDDVRIAPSPVGPRLDVSPFSRASTCGRNPALHDVDRPST